MPPTVYPIGTTIYNPDKCFNGYTLMGFPAGHPSTELIDMNGNIVNKWPVLSIRARLLKNGNLLTVTGAPLEANAIQEHDWNHNLVWEYIPEKTPHHDVVRLENGNTLVICREVVPEEYRAKSEDPERRRDVCFKSDFVLEVTPDKKVVWEWHEYEHLDIDWYFDCCRLADWTHTNTIQALPENKWYDAGDTRFTPGNIFLTLRNLSAIIIVDKNTKEIVWSDTGYYDGGYAGVHEAHMIPKGLPGAGNILIYDNGAAPHKHLMHCGQSYVLEVNPRNKEIVWKYENGENFFSKFRSNIQRLPNGNTLVCESEGPRTFEITVEGEIIWEYAVPNDIVIGRAYRYPYDYCPQLKSFDKPTEKAVIPPSHTNTKPFKSEVFRVDYLWDFQVK